MCPVLATVLALTMVTSNQSALCPSGLVRYLHVPKAASGFAPTIWAYGCGRVPFVKLALRFQKGRKTDLREITTAQEQDECPCLSGSVYWTYKHKPLWGPEAELNAVGLFRSPAERIVSAFNYNLHAHEFNAEARSALRHAVATAKNRSEQIMTFARWPGVAHVQTKMLLGYHVSSAYTPTPADVELACSRVQRMKFAGVVSCFDESVALFQRQFPARYQSEPIRFRETSYANETSSARDMEFLLEGGFRDEPDSRVFCAAMSRFRVELSRYGKVYPSPGCLAAMQGCTK